MKVSFLGRQGSLHSERSGNTCLLIESGGIPLLIDTSGAPAQLIRQAGYDPIWLEMVILTHSHVDHLYGLPSLLHNLWLLKRTAPLRIVGNAETLEKAKALCDVFGIREKPGMFPLRWESGVGRPLYLSDSLQIQLFDVDHGVPTCGISCTDGSVKFAYTADTRPLCTVPLEMFHADLLVHEAGGVEQDEPKLAQGGHSSARQAALTAVKAQAGRLLLCHIPLSETACAAILSEAVGIFPNTGLPDLFVPYELG
ncbi:MAG: MBL fold metallo-hydrolase [Sphaerochaetaceae bacterium]|nr:MBL fold metallo-hydrolase [Sphaerochaetaceae bacterium]